MTAFTIRFIETYRREVGPRVRARCSLEPSCSAYALEAYRTTGWFRASMATARRLVACARAARAAAGGSRRRLLER